MGYAATAGLGEEVPDFTALSQDRGAGRGRPLHSDKGKTPAQFGLVLHPRRHLLAHIAALAEIDAVQTLKAGFQQIAVIGDQFDTRFGDEVLDPDRIPVDRGFGSATCSTVFTPAQCRMTRVGQGTARRFRHPAGHGPVAGCQADIGAQAVQHEAAQGGVGQHLWQVQKQGMPLAAGRDVAHKEIGQILALRCQQGGPDQPRLLGQRQDVIADQPLQEGQGILAAKDHDPAACLRPLVCFGPFLDIGHLRAPVRQI